MSKLKSFIKEAGYYNGFVNATASLTELEKEAVWGHLATAAGAGGAGLLAGKYLSDRGKTAVTPDAAPEMAPEEEQYIDLTPQEYNNLMQLYYQNPYYFQIG
jgi:hypothetical protein